VLLVSHTYLPRCQWLCRTTVRLGKVGKSQCMVMHGMHYTLHSGAHWNYTPDSKTQNALRLGRSSVKWVVSWCDSWPRSIQPNILCPKMHSSHSFRLKSAQCVVKSLRPSLIVQIIMYQVHLKLYFKIFLEYYWTQLLMNHELIRMNESRTLPYESLYQDILRVLFTTHLPFR